MMTNDAKLQDVANTDEWVDLYADSLYQFAFYRLRNKELAEDIVQDTFLSALAAFKSFQGRSSVKTWLISILKNKIIDYYRSSSSKEYPTDFHSESWEDDFTKSGIWKVWVRDWASTPDKLLESDNFIKYLYECYGAMNDRSREVIRLATLEDLSTEEICKELNTTTTNYWVWLHRARMQLRKCLNNKLQA